VLGRAYNHLRSELAALVLADPLTACLNRRGFEQELAREVARSHGRRKRIWPRLNEVDELRRRWCGTRAPGDGGGNEGSEDNVAHGGAMME